jgi:hypothetical protein
VVALDESFFRVRFDRLTPVEKKYLRAMAALGPGPHRSCPATNGRSDALSWLVRKPFEERIFNSLIAAIK